MNRALALLWALIAPIAHANSTSILEMVETARRDQKKIVLIINEPLSIRTARPVSKSITPSSRTTSEIPMKDGRPVDPATETSESEIICTLNVWRGLMQKTETSPEGTFDFNLHGIWHIFEASSKKRSRAVSRDRADFELSLWPARPNATPVEQALYSIDIIIKEPNKASFELNNETLRSCLGPTVQVFIFTPAKK